MKTPMKRAALASLLPLAVMSLVSCGTAPQPQAVSAAIATQTALATASLSSNRLKGVVDSTGWHGIFLPTLQTLSAPVTDYLNPGVQLQAHMYINDHNAAYASRLSRENPNVAKRIATVRNGVAGHWIGEAALLKFYLNGLLLKQTGNQGCLLDYLFAIASAPIANNIDRGTLLNELLSELEEPARVTQGIKATCEAASVEILLARKAPLEYARLVAGLATPKGRVTLASGAFIQRVSDWDSATDGWRSIPGRLLQPAFAVLGNAPLSYSNTDDKNSLGVSGLTDPQVVSLCSDVFAVPFIAQTPANSSNLQRWSTYRQAQAAGWDVPVWVEWGTGHVILGENAGQDAVVFDNPFGALQTLAPSEFRNILHSVYVPQTL